MILRDKKERPSPVRAVCRVAAAVGAVVLSGCAAVQPSVRLPETATPAAAQAQMMDEWNTESVVKEGRQSTVLMTPFLVPRDVRARAVTLELESGATISDFVAALGRLGHSAILANKEVGSKAFFLPKFQGSLGGLLSTISRATNVWFTWHEGVIMVSDRERIAISLPQEAGLAEQISKEIGAMGIAAAVVSSNAAMLTMEVSPNELRQVKAYLERMTANAAVVTLQLALINVTLTQDARQGVDWEGLAVAAGSRAPTSIRDPLYVEGRALYPNTAGTGVVGGNAVTGGGVAPGGGTAATTDPVAAAAAAAAANSLAAVSGALLKGGSLQGVVVAAGKFSFGGVLNYLGKYGNAETRQNTVFKTVTGKEVSFKSLTEVPYVSEVGAVTTVAASNTATQGSVKTAKAQDGLELSVTPAYDAAADTVSVALKLSVKSVLGFNQLSAGNQVGTLSQPTTADRSFNDEIRLRPGQTAVIGGIIFDSVSDSRALPLFLQRGKGLESQALKVDRQAMFIVVRPSVEQFGELGEMESETLELAPHGLLSGQAPASRPVAQPRPRQSQPAAPVGRAPVRELVDPSDYRRLQLPADAPKSAEGGKS